MTDDYACTAVQDWLQPLLKQLRPTEVRQLARAVAAHMRLRQSARIAAQQNPDGSAYAPRRLRMQQTAMDEPQQRERDRVRAMFARLRTSAHLLVRSDAAQASVAFEGRSARIARVHQFGLLDRPQAGGPEVRYPTRKLLGWSDSDLESLRERLLDHLRAR